MEGCLFYNYIKTRTINKGQKETLPLSGDSPLLEKDVTNGHRGPVTISNLNVSQEILNTFLPRRGLDTPKTVLFRLFLLSPLRKLKGRGVLYSTPFSSVPLPGPLGWESTVL